MATRLERQLHSADVLGDAIRELNSIQEGSLELKCIDNSGFHGPEVVRLRAVEYQRSTYELREGGTLPSLMELVELVVTFPQPMAAAFIVATIPIILKALDMLDRTIEIVTPEYTIKFGRLSSLKKIRDIVMSHTPRSQSMGAPNHNSTRVIIVPVPRRRVSKVTEILLSGDETEIIRLIDAGAIESVRTTSPHEAAALIAILRSNKSLRNLLRKNA